MCIYFPELPTPHKVEIIFDYFCKKNKSIFLNCYPKIKGLS